MATVSILVPARNEEACLGACLKSLVEQTGVEKEIIVIDDHSADRTAEIARSFPGVRVIAADPLPAGWCGKQHALYCGAAHAKGEWLLFTDADTVHRPGSLARALAEAQECGAAMLSYSPEQEVRTAWEQAVMPNIFAELARTYRPSDICDPASSAAAANGQYLLITREAYDAIGGHAAVCDTLLEDVAIARAIKRSGRRIRFRYGGEAVKTRMYRSFAAMREGWTKNLGLLFPNARRLGTMRTAEFVLIAASAAGSAAALAMHSRFAVLPIAALVVSYSNFLRRVIRAHFGWVSNVTAVFGLPLFSYLLWRSAIYYASGRAIAWRGRSYHFPADATRPQTAAVSKGEV